MQNAAQVVEKLRITQVLDYVERRAAENAAAEDFRQHTNAGMPPKRTERHLYAPIKYNLEYVTTGLHESVSRAFWGVQWWLNDITHSQKQLRRWCYLFGVNGCGKTHLCQAARKVVKEAGKRSLIYSWADIVDRLFASHGDSLPIYCNIPILFVDDIGKEKAAGGGAEMVNGWLFQLLNARMNKWTFITSNLSPEQIGERYDTALASRLCAGRVKNTMVDMRAAKDFRKMRALQHAPYLFEPF